MKKITQIILIFLVLISCKEKEKLDKSFTNNTLIDATLIYKSFVFVTTFR